MENGNKKEEWVQPERIRLMFDPVMFVLFLMGFFAHYGRHDFATGRGVLDTALLYLFGCVLYYRLRKDMAGYRAADHFLNIGMALNVVMMVFNWLTA